MDNANTTQRLLSLLISSWDNGLGRWRSSSDQDIFTNYVVIWLLAEFGLADIPQCAAAALWLESERDPLTLRWSDATGSKPAEMTHRALVALILAGRVRSHHQLDLYLSWTLALQQRQRGAWAEEHKHVLGKPSYGATLPAAMFLKECDSRFSALHEETEGAKTSCRLWMQKRYSKGILWSFTDTPGERNLLATCWAIRIAANLDIPPGTFVSEGIEHLQRIIPSLYSSVNVDSVHLTYNVLHSLSLFRVQNSEIERLFTESLSFLDDQYTSDLTNTREGIRHLAGTLISLARYLKLTEDGRRSLAIIRERLRIQQEATSTQVHHKTTTPTGLRVFLVHGRNTPLAESVARFIETIGLDPIILREQPNTGLTVIEKLERDTDTCFAIVLLTGEDSGGLIGSGLQERRGRQNVIFELGYVLARLGRGRIAVLYEPGTELPSDFAGVLYVELDTAGAWKVELAREMRTAGLKIDLNFIIGNGTLYGQ